MHDLAHFCVLSFLFVGPFITSSIDLTSILPHDAVLASYVYMLSSCVRLSVRHKLVFYQSGQT